MISAVFIFSAKGDVLMSRLLKSGIRQSVSDVFRIQVIASASRANTAASAQNARSPVLTLGSTSFLHIRFGPMWLVAVTRSNQDAAAVLEFLSTFAALLRHFFQKDPAATPKEDAITANFTAIYGMLGEMLPFGFPTNTEPAYLASVVPGLPQPKTGFDFQKALTKSSEKASERAAASAMDHSYDAGAVSWREPGIKYRRNEVFLNVDEKVYVTLDSQGRCLRSYIDGVLTLKAHLSGMPICRFGFADEGSISGLPGKISFDDFKFHKCVDMAKYDADQVIRFVPPDGTFQLMSYHISNQFVPPFKVIPRTSLQGNTLSIRITLRSIFESTIAATGVTLSIPVPVEVIKNTVTCSNGKAKYNAGENRVLWKLSKMYGESEHTMYAELKLSEEDEFSQKSVVAPKAPISLDFNIDMFSASGLSVKFLKVTEKANYRTVKWIKYSASAGSYEIRT